MVRNSVFNTYSAYFKVKGRQRNRQGGVGEVNAQVWNDKSQMQDRHSQDQYTWSEWSSMTSRSRKEKSEIKIRIGMVNIKGWNGQGKNQGKISQVWDQEFWYASQISKANTRLVSRIRQNRKDQIKQR